MREPLFVGLVVVDATRLADERAELRQLRQEGGSLGSHRPCFTLVALEAHQVAAHESMSPACGQT